MTDYRTPMPAVLAASLEAAINRLLAMDEDSPRRLNPLDQRMVRLELEGLGIDLYFSFSARRVTVALDAGKEPDAVIRGTPPALFSMAVPDSEGHWGTAGSRVQIAGDATLARDLERLFSRLDPDWEGQLSIWFGDVLGHQLTSGARSVSAHLGETVRTLEDIAGDYLHKPSSPLARHQEVRDFSQSVDALRDAAARLEARLRILKAYRTDNAASAEDGG